VPCAIAPYSANQTTECPIRAILANGTAERPDKKPGGGWELGLPAALVFFERSHGRWMQRQYPSGTTLDRRNTKGARDGIEMSVLQPESLALAKACADE
jgi:hypothetical protein